MSKRNGLDTRNNPRHVRLNDLANQKQCEAVRYMRELDVDEESGPPVIDRADRKDDGLIRLNEDPVTDR